MGAGCWFGPAWIPDRPIWIAAWPWAGQTVLGSASRAARFAAAEEESD